MKRLREIVVLKDMHARKKNWQSLKKMLVFCELIRDRVFPDEAFLLFIK